MSTQFKNLIYNLERSFGHRMTVKKYNPCDIDFSNPKFNASTEQQEIKAVALPKHGVQVNFIPNQGDYEVYDRVFLIKAKSLKFELVPKQCYIIFNSDRYAIKSLETFENIFYLAKCIGVPGEPDE